MKTNNDFSAHSAKGLGAVVAHASQRGNQRNVIVTHAIPEQSSPIPADAPTRSLSRSLSQRGNQRNVTLGSVTYLRAAMTPQTAVTITKGSFAEDLCYTANYAVGAHDGITIPDGVTSIGRGTFYGCI